jgi:hypothetical protein
MKLQVSIVLVSLLVMAGVTVPKVWDDRELASMEVPLARPEFSPKHITSDYYYKIPPRSVYKSYPIYAPGKEPAGYKEWLERQEPQVVFDAAKLKSKADWIKAGDLVFDAPIGYGATFKLSQVQDPSWYEQIGVPVTKDGVMPFSRYVIRKKGVVEVGSGGCVMCHARVMPDGSFVKGAQGNFPADRAIAYNLRHQAMDAKDSPEFLKQIRLGQRAFFAAPWLESDPSARIDTMSLEEIAAAYDAIPPGVSTRVNLSLFSPAQIPSLIGIADVRHLDHTGIVVQRSIADLMRYIALVQGANSFDRYGDFALVESLPDPSRLDRYSDEQLYALAQFLYALKPPRNPNAFDSRAKRGAAVFAREGCVNCHTPPLYTSDKLIPVDVVGTDPTLALKTRKGTGFYKIPSLRGVWYRGPFQHNGAARTLEEWLDPNRISRIPGHPFGLQLSPEDRRALIAFLKSL